MTEWVEWDDERETRIEWEKQELGWIPQADSCHDPNKKSGTMTADRSAGRVETITAVSIISWIIGIAQIIIGILSLSPSLLAFNMNSGLSETAPRLSETAPPYGLCVLLAGGVFVAIGTYLWFSEKKKQHHSLVEV